MSDLRELLDDKITTPPESTEIDLWLDSPGGDAHAAYKLIVDLRNRCRRIRAVVADMAKSAATLLVLGVDKVLMGAAAELGPLDVQMEHPSREGQIVSGLDVANSLEFLGQTAVNLIVSGGAAVIQFTQLPRTEVLKDLSLFAAHFLRPAVSKLDPHLTHRAYNMLQVAERYAELLLKMRHPDNQLSAELGRQILHKLVHDYPAHEFIISREEARQLGLPIENAESYPYWELVKRICKKVSHDTQIVTVMTEDEVRKVAGVTLGSGTNGASHEDTAQQSTQAGDGAGGGSDQQPGQRRPSAPEASS